MYNLGGFSLPFFCIGTYAIVASLMFCLAVPGFEAGEEKEMKSIIDKKKKVSLLDLIQVPYKLKKLSESRD